MDLFVLSIVGIAAFAMGAYFLKPDGHGSADVNSRELPVTMQEILAVHLAKPELAVKKKQDVLDYLVTSSTPIKAHVSFSPTGLHHAADTGSVDEIISYIKHGADINAKDALEATPLHHALYYGNKQAAEILINKGANINAQNIFGYTPLHFAVDDTDEIGLIIPYLLHQGADLSIANVYGNTPLHLAAEIGYVWTTKLLLSHGANPLTKNKYGKTALEIAQQRRHPEIVAIIEEHLQSRGNHA